LIGQIIQDQSLVPYLRILIEDEGINVTVDPTLEPEKDYIAIKVDAYYSDLRLGGLTPKSVDFVVVVDGECDCYALYILELKDINSPSHLIISDIQEKFFTTIYDFLSDRFKEIFLNDRVRYKLVKLYFISDLYHIADKFNNYKEYKHYLTKREQIFKRDSLKVEYSLGQKLYKFRGKLYRIEYDIPPNPIIKKLS
jgi:hypothetical protein